MKCDEGSDAWNNLRTSNIHVFLQTLGQHVPRKKNMEFAKVRQFFLAKMTFSRWKNLEQPSYILYPNHSKLVHVCAFILYFFCGCRRNRVTFCTRDDNTNIEATTVWQQCEDNMDWLTEVLHSGLLSCQGILFFECFWWFPSYFGNDEETSSLKGLEIVQTYKWFD